MTLVFANIYKIYIDLYGGVQEWGYPKSSVFDWDFPFRKQETIHLWGQPPLMETAMFQVESLFTTNGKIASMDICGIRWMSSALIKRSHFFLDLPWVQTAVANLRDSWNL